MLTNQPQIHLKLLLKEQFKKQQNELVIFLVIKLLIELRKSHHKILQRQLNVKQKQQKKVYISRRKTKNY